MYFSLSKVGKYLLKNILKILDSKYKYFVLKRFYSEIIKAFCFKKLTYLNYCTIFINNFRYLKEKD